MRFAMAIALALAGSLRGATPAPSVIGDWEGLLDLGTARVHLVLHLAPDRGGLQGSMETSGQPGANGIVLTSASFHGGTLVFACNSVMASFSGKLRPDGAAIEGVWTQLKQYPMSWTRARNAAPEPVSAADFVGAWEGDLRIGLVDLGLVVRLQPASGGGLNAVMDTPDNGQFGISARSAKVDNGFLTIEWNSLATVFKGRLNPAHSTLYGSWSREGAEGQFTLQRTKQQSGTSRSRPQTPVKPYPYREEQVSFASGSGRLEIAATLTMPEGAGPFPAAVLIAGSGPNDRDESIAGHKIFLILADYLTRQGIAVLRFDKRGVGESTGYFPNAVTTDFATDVAAAVHYMTFRKTIDRRRIGLVGHSEGGLIAPMVAAKDHNIAFVVLLAGPGVAGPELAGEQAESEVLLGGGNPATAAETGNRVRTIATIVNREQGHLSKLKSDLRAELGSGLSDEAIDTILARFDNAWLLSLLAIDPADALRKVTCPVLALNGSKDTQVPAGPNLGAIANALSRGGSRVTEVAQLPGLNHLFQTAQTGAPDEYRRIAETMSPIALDKIATWILQRVN